MGYEMYAMYAMVATVRVGGQIIQRQRYFNNLVAATEYTNSYIRLNKDNEDFLYVNIYRAYFEDDGMLVEDSERIASWQREKEDNVEEVTYD